MATRTITLIRHGQYDTDSTITGGGDLLPTGWEQTEYLAQALHNEGTATNIYTSTMRRALTTAHIIATTLPDLPFKQDKMLMEALFYIPRGTEHVFGNVKTSTLAKHRVRVAYAYKKYTAPAKLRDEHDVLVCHGNIIRYFLVRAKRASIETWANTEIYHASITRLRVDKDGLVSVVCENNIKHLPTRLHTVS
ncbi:MAG: histidine phosphatase family protein [Chloroflexota bacterium]